MTNCVARQDVLLVGQVRILLVRQIEKRNMTDVWETTRDRLINKYLQTEIARIKADEEIKALKQTSRCTADDGWPYCMDAPDNACPHCQKIRPLYQKRKTAKLLMITARKMLSRHLRNSVNKMVSNPV